MSAGKEQKKINTKDTCASTSSSSFVMRFALAVVMSLTCSSATTVRADFVAAVTPFFPKKKRSGRARASARDLLLHLNTRWVRPVRLKVGVHVAHRFGVQIHFIHWMPQLCERENATVGLTGEGERGSQGGEGEREEEQKSWREVCHGVVTKRAPAALTVRLTCCMFYVRVSETVGE